MEMYVFLVFVTMVAAQGEVPQQPPRGVPVQQNQDTQQVPVGQGQQNIEIQQQQDQILQQQQQIIRQQQQQQAVNMQQQGHQAVHHAAEGGRNLIRDRNHVQDREHMMQDLEGVIGTMQQELSDDEVNFYYFKLHDADHNNRLDGLEMMKALSHYDRSRDAHPDEQRAVPSEEELIELVDGVLEDDDRNRDGYVDYPEFSSSLLHKTSI